MSGCYSTREIPVHEFWEHRPDNIVSVVTKSGDVIEFPENYPANYDHSEHSITGISISGMVINLPADDIIWVKVRQVDSGKTISIIVMGVGIIVGIIFGSLFIIFFTTIEN